MPSPRPSASRFLRVTLPRPVRPARSPHAPPTSSRAPGRLRSRARCRASTRGTRPTSIAGTSFLGTCSRIDTRPFGTRTAPTSATRSEMCTQIYSRLESLEELEAYPWTGHAILVGTRPSDLLDLPAALGAFAGAADEARAALRDFMRDWPPAESHPLDRPPAPLHLPESEAEACRVSREFGPPYVLTGGSRRREVCCSRCNRASRLRRSSTPCSRGRPSPRGHAHRRAARGEAREAGGMRRGCPQKSPRSMSVPALSSVLAP